MLNGYENLKAYFIGIDKLLGENSGYVYIEGDNKEKGVLAQCNINSILGNSYDIFDFKQTPFKFLGHYSTSFGKKEEKFNGEMGKCPFRIEDIIPVDCALNAALSSEVMSNPLNN